MTSFYGGGMKQFESGFSSQIFSIHIDYFTTNQDPRSFSGNMKLNGRVLAFTKVELQSQQAFQQSIAQLIEKLNTVVKEKTPIQAPAQSVDMAIDGRNISELAISTEEGVQYISGEALELINQELSETILKTLLTLNRLDSINPAVSKKEEEKSFSLQIVGNAIQNFPKNVEMPANPKLQVLLTKILLANQLTSDHEKAMSELVLENAKKAKERRLDKEAEKIEEGKLQEIEMQRDATLEELLHLALEMGFEPESEGIEDQSDELEEFLLGQFGL